MPERNPHLMPRGELEMAIDNKRHLESRSAEILSGELTVKEGGPMELRPKLPDELKGSLLRGYGRNVRRGADDTGIDAAKRKHRQAVLAGLLHPDVKVEYLLDGSYSVTEGA